MTPLCPEVHRGILEQRSLSKSAGNATRNRISMVVNGTKRAPVVVSMESQAEAPIMRKRLDFPWFSTAHRVITARERLLMPPAVGSHGSGPGKQDTSALFAAGVFRAKVPFSLPRGVVLWKFGMEAGSYQTPRQCLLQTPGILILVFMVQEHQPSDPLRAPDRDCVPSITPGQKEPQRLRGMLEVARDDGNGSCWQQTPLQPQKKNKRKRSKRARLTSLLPFPFPCNCELGSGEAGLPGEAQGLDFVPAPPAGTGLTSAGRCGSRAAAPSAGMPSAGAARRPSVFITTAI